MILETEERNQKADKDKGASMELIMQIMKQVGIQKELHNFVFSPLSICILLSIVACGQKPGPILDRLLSLLGFETIADLHVYASDDQLNASLFYPSTDPVSQGPILSSSNVAWVDKKFTLNPSFRRLLKTLFHGKSFTVDFQNQTKEAIMEINRWAKKATKGLIKKFLTNSAARKELVLIIANALYFKGAWYDPFDEFNTRYHEFYTLDGENTVQVPFMFKGYESLSYASSIGFKILRLPYLNGNEITNVSRRRFAMYFFLPDEKDGLFNLLDQFSSNPDLLNLQIEFQKTEIRELRIPKFKFKCRFEVSKIMELLGLTMNIKDAEILEGLGEDVPLKNSKIIHNCCIELNECGTEAVADTEDENMGFSLYDDSPPPIDFIADHPFIFMIREEISRTNVFLGAVLNPLSQ